MTETKTTQMLSVKEAAAKLKLHPLTIRRQIKDGKLKAELVEGKFGKSYMVEVPIDQVAEATDVKQLLTQIADLNNNVGFWRGRATELEYQNRQLTETIKLLSTPKETPLIPPAPMIISTTTPSRSWFKRLFNLR
jgi:excisionase family DNA binding protein